MIWYHNGQPVKESKDMQLLFEGDRCTLVIREILPEDAGEYKCVARNIQGEAESACILHVERKCDKDGRNGVYQGDGRRGRGDGQTTLTPPIIKYLWTEVGPKICKNASFYSILAYLGDIRKTTTLF